MVGPRGPSVDSLDASSYQYGTSTVTGDGHVIVRIDYTPPLAITSAASDSVASSTGSFTFSVTANGEPAPSFSLSGQPSWVSIDPPAACCRGRSRPDRRPVPVHHHRNQRRRADGHAGVHVVGDRADAGRGRQGQADDPVGLSRTLTLTALGGIAPYTWSLASGTLPTGLALHGNGTLTGTPTATGRFIDTFLLTDSAIPTHETATVTVAIRVVARTVTITTLSPLPPATVGHALHDDRLRASGRWRPSTGA